MVIYCFIIIGSYELLNKRNFWSFRDDSCAIGERVASWLMVHFKEPSPGNLWSEH